MECCKQALNSLLQPFQLSLEPRARRPRLFILPGKKFRVGAFVELANSLYLAAQVFQMLLAGVNQPVHNHAVEPLLGGNGQQFLRQSDVLFCGETQAINYFARCVFGRFDPFADFYLLFAREQRNLAHLPQVHADRIIQDLETLAFFVLDSRRSGPVHFGRVDNLDVQVPELGQDPIQIFGCHGVFGKGIVDVLISEVALVARQPDQLLRLFHEIQPSHRPARSRKGSNGLLHCAAA